MASPFFEPFIYGDSGSELGGHEQAGDQVMTHNVAVNGPGSLVGDAPALRGHARGGDDTLDILSPGGATAVGDAFDITGHARGGGDDVFASGQGEAFALGDAATLDDHARGGDDLVEAVSAFSAVAIGDAVLLTGRAKGGDDQVTGQSGHGPAELFGDAETIDGRAVGGDDTLTGQTGFTAIMYGDAELIDDRGRGGDDLLIAAARPLSAPPGVYTLFGDADQLLGAARGGDDTLVGGANQEDRLWGDAAVVGADARTGADLFVFAPDTGLDEVMDFEPGKDRISLQGFGFDSFQDLAGSLQATAAGVRIVFDAENAILVRDVSQLSAGDFIFG